MSLDIDLIQVTSFCEHCQRGESKIVYSANITHNLTAMAAAAGIYKHIWRPEELGIKRAVELISPLTIGLHKLKEDMPKFKQYEPQNGWGSYYFFVEFVTEYLKACIRFPDARIEVDR